MNSASSSLGRYWFLDSVAGWQKAFLDGLEPTSKEGDLVLDGLPGSALPLLDEAQQTAEFKCPTALRPDGHGNLFVVDAGLNLVKRIDLARSTVTTLTAIGGKGSGPRELFEPRGIAVLSTGSVIIADTRNHHVKIFSSAMNALLQDWGTNNALGHPEPGTGSKMFRFPWTVAVDACNSIHVVDRGNRRIQIIRADGAWQYAFSENDWVSPTRLAVGSDGLMAVVDAGTKSVTVLAGGVSQLLSTVENPQSVTIDDEARIYVGDAEGLVHVFVPDPNQPNRYESALDSNTPNCQWHRVLLNASVPAGTSIQIDSFTAEPTGPVSQVTSQVTGDAFNQWKLCVKAGNDNPDCLVQSGPGRYLWLRLTFNSNGLSSPELKSLKVFYPRVSYLQYLPAVYQENESSRQFLERFLSIFQTEFDGLDYRIDRIWQLFNPGSIPPKDLGWLASWLGVVVNPAWSNSKLRSIIKNAFTAQCLSGTIAGLTQAVQDYVGVKPVVVEHFQLRQWTVLSSGASLDSGTRLWSQAFYKRLQIASNSQIGNFQLVSDPAPDVEPMNWDAHQFTVMFVASPYGSGDIEQQISQVVEREKPAHTQASICPLLPRFRVGVQSTIGTDSVVGGISYLVLNQLATLGYDSILGCSIDELKLRQLGIAPQPRVGLSAKLS
jgi:phage tail-like protein